MSLLACEGIAPAQPPLQPVVGLPEQLDCDSDLAAQLDVVSPEGAKATVACSTSLTTSFMCLVGRPGSVAYIMPREKGPTTQ